MIFDTHAHYYDEAFDADRDALLASLPGRGVALVVCSGCDPESSRQSIALAERYGFLYAAAGHHPENLEGAALSDLDAVRALCAHPKVVAVGEIGLDYYWLKTPEERANSRDFFDAQLSLAEELNLPAIVHDRDAHRDCLDIVRAHPGVRGVFHCYSGSPEMAKELLKLGWYLGFDGPITFKNARRAPEVAAVTPLERMLLETDAPYLAPVPHRGKRNDSRLLPLVAEKLGEWKGLAPEAVAEAAFRNAVEFFGLEKEMAKP